MKYTMEKREDGKEGTYRLFCHGKRMEGISKPNNVELEFWLEIEKLRDKLVECGKELKKMAQTEELIQRLTDENERLEMENGKLRKRIKQLEAGLRVLGGVFDKLGG